MPTHLTTRLARDVPALSHVAPVLLWLLLCTSSLASASQAGHPHPARVLFLGDSITSCSGLNADFTKGHLSFRKPLWELAEAEGWGRSCMDWVGARSGCNRRFDRHVNASSLFPQRHDAYFGRPLEAAVLEIDSVLDQRPDVVVVCLGINDLIVKLGSKTPAHVEKRMRDLYGRLLVALLPNTAYGPGGSRQVVMVTLPPLNADLLKKKALKRAAGLLDAADSALIAAAAALPEASRHRVHVANISVGFDAAAMLYDGLHPGATGEEHIAKRIAAVLRRVLRARSGCEGGASGGAP
jgi:lysophospholipase L1-like esterase